MADAFARPRSVLADAAFFNAAGAALAAAPDLTRVVFRGDGDASRLCGEAFGVGLPREACRSEARGDRAALWLGPDEWLLLAPEAEGDAFQARLGAALAPVPHSLVDVSHRQTGLVLSGPRAARLLNAACPLDLDASAFPPGMATRTIFAKAEIVLWRRGAEAFHVEVWRSFAPYLTGLMREAARSLAF